jgi:nicotinamide phosphoribosyltransferase
MENFNIVAFGTDSYKHSHHGFYPDGLQTVYSYCEPRVGARFSETTFFGLQYIISRYLTGQVVTRDKIEEAAAMCAQHFGSEEVFNREGWEHILNVHDGKLPIRITALPEGMSVPAGTCLFTIENTDPQVPWLTNYLETLLMQIWSPTTVCSGSHAVKNIISNYLGLTGDPAGLPFKLHDFGYRGVSSLETAALAGAAHLVNFMGTDTLAAIPLLRDYYGAKDMPAFSIPATEHSIMTAGGPDGEADIVRRILRTHPTGLVAMVGDSFDMYKFVTDVIGKNPDILEMIKNREGTVVIRPDSGDLPDIDLDVFHAIESVFGSEMNDKGFRVLPPYVRMIQGDGIKWYRSLRTHHIGNGMSVPIEDSWTHTVDDILHAFYRERISADNIAFGSGGGLLQDFTRDTQRFAIKCSAMQINNEWVDIYKQPKTDPTKNSKRGRLSVIVDEYDEIRTIKQDDPQYYTCAIGKESNVFQNMLQVVFEDGKLERFQTLDEIRERANENILSNA